ncbi:hypothetical protein C7E12_01915 [Stenotrophomonas maltophilia]|nr:hypothetical protein C7E12_01915 [Stenotrophomonas maltophilia]
MREDASQLPRLSCALLRTGVPNMSTTTATNTTKLSTELADGCNLAVVINVRALQLRGCAVSEQMTGNWYS